MQPPGPVRYTLGSIQNAFAGVRAAFKTPKLLLPTIVMTLIWTALSYLKLLLPESVLVYIASLFTFAQGGMYGGFLGAVGGLVGKALFSYVLSVTLMPLLTGQKRTPKPRAPRSSRPGMFPYALFGLGCALVAYHFMTGNASLENAMIGITAFTACRKQHKSDSGFVVGLLLSFTKGRFTRADARPALSGLMAGFLAGVGLSLLQIGKLSAPVGLALAIIALLIGLFTRSKRLRAGVAAAVLLLAVSLPFARVARAYSPYDDIGKTSISGSVMHRDTRLDFEISGGIITEVKSTEDMGYNGVRTYVAQISPGETITISCTGEERPDSIRNVARAYIRCAGYWEDEADAYPGQSMPDASVSYTVQESDIGYTPFIQAAVFFSSDIESGPATYTPTVIVEYHVVGEPAQREEDVHVSGQWELRERTLRLYDYYGDRTFKLGRDYPGPMDYLAVTEDNAIRYETGDISLSVSFSTPPSVLLPEEPLIVENPQYDFQGYLCAVFYGKSLPPENVGKDASYLDHGQTMLEKYRPDGSLNSGSDGESGQYHAASIPPGGSEGEILVVTCMAGTQSEDIWINYIYDWVPTVYTPAPEEDEEHLDGFEDDFEDDWEEDWGDYDSGATDEELEEWLDRISSGNPFGDDGDEHTAPVETGIIDIIAILAALLGLGGAGGSLGGLGGGPGGGDLGPHIRKDGDGDLIATDPVTGEERLYKQNPDGTYTNPLTGATVTEGDLQSQLGSRAEHKGQIQQDLDAAQQAIEQQRADNQNLSAQYAGYNDAGLQIVIDKLNNDGSDYALTLAKKLQEAKDEGKATGNFDDTVMGQLQKNYSNYSQGHSIAGGEFPPGKSNWELAGETLGLVGAELTRPTSVLGMAGRGVLAAGTGGASEWAFNTAGAAMTMKDVIDAGGSTSDAVIAAGKEWGASIAAGEALRGVGKALKKQPKLSGKQLAAANKATSLANKAGMKAANAKTVAAKAAEKANAQAAKAGTLVNNTKAAQTTLSKNTAALNKGKAQLTSAKNKLNGVEKQRQQLMAKSKASPSPETQKQLTQLNAQKNKLQLEVEKQTRDVNFLSKETQAAKNQLSSLKKETNLALSDAEAAKKTADALNKTAQNTDAAYRSAKQQENAMRNPPPPPSPGEKMLTDGTVAAGSLPIQDEIKKRI